MSGSTISHIDKKTNKRGEFKAEVISRILECPKVARCCLANFIQSTQLSRTAQLLHLTTLKNYKLHAPTVCVEPFNDVPDSVTFDSSIFVCMIRV